MQVLILKGNTSKCDRNVDVAGATQAKTWMDFAAWSPVPWTGQEEEPLPVMAAKARFLGMQFLQRQWEEQVGLIDRSLGALRAPTSRLRPFGPALGPSGLLDNVLHALRALRPCDPRNSAMMG